MLVFSTHYGKKLHRAILRPLSFCFSEWHSTNLRFSKSFRTTYGFLVGHQLALTIVNTVKTYVFTIYLITVIQSVNPSYEKCFILSLQKTSLHFLACFTSSVTTTHISKYLLVNNEELTFGKRLIDPI